MARAPWRVKSNKPDIPANEISIPPAESPVGIGLRASHYREVIETKPAIGWLEVHPENYFGGGSHRHFLSQARELYPISFHAVGLSLGSVEQVNTVHLGRIRELIGLYEPYQVSDHASWSMSGNAHLNDLLPLPYTEETLTVLCRNIDRTQEYLGRRILVENPSTYLAFRESTMPEWEFMNQAAKRTGCGILLDVNNIYVQAHNHGLDAREYLRGIEVDHVGEIHLAGHTQRQTSNGAMMLIDTHNALVCAEVWELYRFVLQRTGILPTLIEWDQDLPPLQTLLDEVDRATACMNERELSCAAG